MQAATANCLFWFEIAFNGDKWQNMLKNKHCWWEAGRWICSSLPFHLILFLEHNYIKHFQGQVQIKRRRAAVQLFNISKVNAVFIQQTMRVAQADQELIIKQRIRVLGCQISYMGFCVVEKPRPKPFLMSGAWFQRRFVFHLDFRKFAQLKDVCVENSKLSPRP